MNEQGTTRGLRARQLERLQKETLDVLVIGGGINGAASLLALAAHGARAGLIDRGDFACETSQSSSNLIWGGIKYLEHLEFPLVWHLCASRNRLLELFPGSVRETRFLTLPGRGLKQSLPVLYAGTWLYWLLGRRRTRPPALVSRAEMAEVVPALSADTLRHGLEYSDACLPATDARFTLDFVFAAVRAGAAAANYAEAVSARREKGGWLVRVRDRAAGTEFDVRCRAVVNACGPFADKVNSLLGVETRFRHVFSRGAHLVVPRLQRRDEVVVIFAPDGRPFFILPFGELTIIGTTDTPVESPEAACTAEDRRFILETANAYLRPERRLLDGDVVAERCGIRPLALEKGRRAAADWMALSRRHKIETDTSAAALTIFGGKLTDCLNVAEEVVSEARAMGLTLRPPDPLWHGALKPEGEKTGAAGPPLVELGGESYTRTELERMAAEEMAVTEEDFLRRRTALALKAKKDGLLDRPGVREALDIVLGRGGGTGR